MERPTTFDDIFSAAEEGMCESPADSPMYEEGPIHGGGERMMYVSDDGLLDALNDEAFNVEFRNKLPVVSEMQYLSQVFRTSFVADFEDDRMKILTKEKHETVNKYRFLNYAEQHFQKGHVPACNDEQIPHPLLPKQIESSTQASLMIWRAIRRFIDTSNPDQDPSKRSSNKPIMMQVCMQLDPPRLRSARNSTTTPVTPGTPSSVFDGPELREKNDNKSRKSSLRQLKDLINSTIKGTRKQSRPQSDEIPIPVSRADSILSRSSSVMGGNGYDNATMVEEINEINAENIPASDLDLVHYIIAHGILRPELRDEIYCQLCCQVVDNESAEKTDRGWLLHAMCSSCFLPSTELLNYYYAFLHDAPSTVSEYTKYIMNILPRTNANGMRFHPPNWNEFQGIKERRKITLKVALPDQTEIPLEVDSATSSSEMCENLASILNLKDSFGFSIYVSIHSKSINTMHCYRKSQPKKACFPHSIYLAIDLIRLLEAYDKVSSLGSGMDHVMDAITECEQLIRGEGLSEKDAPWKVFYRKELFTPWHDATYDRVSTNIIYKQIIEGVRREDYIIPTKEELETFVARCVYIDLGTEPDLNSVKSKLSSYVSLNLLYEGKVIEKLAQAVLKAFERLELAKEEPSIDDVKAEIVTGATALWPMHFSAMFEAFRYTGPQAPITDVVVAVNRDGVFVLDTSYHVLMGFHFYDIVNIVFNGCPDPRRATVRLYAIDGAQFTFLSPNAETLAKMIQAFLDGLRRRSEWAVAIQPFTLQALTGTIGESAYQMAQGDLIQLLPMPDTVHYAEWMYGRCERTRTSGMFPQDVVYVIPSINKPAEEFVKVFTQLPRTMLDNLPRKEQQEVQLNRGGQDQFGEESLA